MDGGCIVPVSHKLNHDGYFRKTWAVAKGKKVTEMFHRFVYRAVHNLSAIPQGYEIDHMCRNRACQNPQHLRLLDRPTHLDITNRVRWDEYRERQAALA